MILCLLPAACSGGGGNASGGDRVIAEPFTAELWSVPPGDVQEDFLLAGPMDFTVDATGNLVVLDENRLKVFRPDGSPWKVEGREGQGPGEFLYTTEINVSETGLLSVRTGGGGPSHSHFSSELSFLFRDDYRNENPYEGLEWGEELFWDRPQGMVLYDPDHRLYGVTARPREAAFGEDRLYHLFYETPDSLHTLARYRYDNMLAGSRMGMTLPFLGDFFFAPLDGRRVVFTHTGVDRIREGEQARYVLHLLDLDTMERRRIEHAYEPEPVGVEDVEDRLVDPEQFDDENNRRIYREMNTALLEGITEYSEKGPLLGLLADRDRIFAVTGSMQDSTRALTDVFDAGTGSHLMTTWIPMSRFGPPTIRLIRGGRAYGMNDFFETGEDPRITCYRMNPGLYR